MISGGLFRAARFIDRNNNAHTMKRFPTLFALSLISALGGMDGIPPLALERAQVKL